jgi:hypothetical protein
MTEPVTLQPERKFLSGRKVEQRYDIDEETRRRWQKNPKLDFPKPAMVINGRPKWDEEALVKWERKRARAVGR